MTFMNDDHDCMLLLLQLAKSIDHFEHSKNTEMCSREYLILLLLLLNVVAPRDMMAATPPQYYLNSANIRYFHLSS
jgi:hypothetical protein